MHSIRSRLALLFITVTTVTLAVFGLYGQLSLSKALQAQFEQTMEQTQARLSISLPVQLWDFNESNALAILESEMLPPDVRAILVFDRRGKLFASTTRADDGKIVSGGSDVPKNAIQRETPLKYSAESATQNPDRELVGRAVVYFSDDSIRATLREDIARRVAEILLIDLVLVVALVLSLRIVFEPLKKLRDALFELADHESESIEELPETQKNEFGEVIQGFNKTQRKFQQVIARRTQAEESARAAMVSAEAALASLQTAQQSLVQAEKMASLGGLVAGVAHEINTPVGITITGASVLIDATATLKASMEGGALRKSDIMALVAKLDEGTQLIMSNAQRAAQLIQNFKQVAADQTSEMRRPYELGEYIGEVMSSLGPRLRRSNVRVHVAFTNRVELDGYPGAMAQVLTNLTTNALAHAFDEDATGSTLTVDAQVQDDMVTMRFSDNGRGIPPEHVSKVFDPFFTTKRGQGGTGLGLNIIHNILVKQFGGSITVASTVGQGTTFEMKFPRVTP